MAELNLKVVGKGASKTAKDKFVAQILTSLRR